MNSVTLFLKTNINIFIIAIFVLIFFACGTQQILANNSKQLSPAMIVGTDTTGALKVDTHSSTLGARWRRIGTTVWKADEATEYGLAPGTYWVEFEDKLGFKTPEDKMAQIEAGKTTVVHATYEATHGSLKGDTHPSGLNAGWRRAGTTKWLADQEIEYGLDAGSYTVEWQPLQGYVTPSNTTAQVNVGDTTCVEADYVEDTSLGSLKAKITPESINAQWRRTGTSVWFENGAEEKGLDPGTYIVQFSSVTGFDKPADVTVVVYSGKKTEFGAEYTVDSTRGALQVDTHHSDLKARWRRSSSNAWMADGEIESGLLPGKCIVVFEPKAGYLTPENKVAYIVAGKLTVVHATYESNATTGSLKVDTHHSSLKARWRRIGTTQWLADEYTEKELNPGVYWVEFESIAGHITPANQQAVIEKGKTTELHVTYIKGDPDKASLQVDTHHSSLKASWRRVGTAVWMPDNEIESGLEPGSVAVEFETINGYVTPANQTAVLEKGKLTVLHATYEKGSGTGAIKVTIKPNAAAEEGAVFAVASGIAKTWYHSETTVEGLKPGQYIVTFNKINGWKAPGDKTVTVIDGKTIYVTGEYEKSVAQPIIKSLYASHKNIIVGDTTTLHWYVENATSVSITPEVGEGLPLSGKAIVSPTATTVFTLRASNSEYEVMAETNVIVSAEPSILFFNADNSVENPLSKGASTNVHFGVLAAQRVTLREKGKSNLINKWRQTGEMTHQVSPFKTTTYVLEAHSNSRTVSREVTVGVTPLPVINSFHASKKFLVAEKNNVTFNWSVSGADKLVIQPNLGDVKSNKYGNGKKRFTISKPGDYTLVATNASGKTERIVSIRRIKNDKQHPDLAVELNDIVGTPSFVNAPVGANAKIRMGETGTVKFTINNIGEKAAKDFDVILTGRFLQERSVHIKQLKAGDQKTLEFTLLPFHAGELKGRVVVDPENEVIDHDTGNNILNFNVLAVNSVGPDPMITDVKVTKLITEQKGRWIAVTYTVFNAGVNRVTNLQSRITVDSMLVADEYIGTLKMKGIIENTIYYRLKDGTDNFRLKIKVDPHRAIDELNEDNNTFNNRILWNSLPQ